MKKLGSISADDFAEAAPLLPRVPVLPSSVVFANPAAPTFDGSGSVAPTRSSRSSDARTTSDAIPGESLSLTALRLAAGAGSTFISFGALLKHGQVSPAGVSRIALYKNGSEVPSYIEALEGRYDDGSIISLLVQHDAGAMTNGVPVSGYELRFNITPNVAPIAKNVAAIKSLPDGAWQALPSHYKNRVVGIYGPLLPLNEMASTLGTNWETADTKLSTALDVWWGRADFDCVGDEDSYTEIANQPVHLYGPIEHFSSFYDRATLHLQYWARGGASYNLERGLRMASACTLRAIAEAYNFQAHIANVMCHGIGYWLTGWASHRTAAFGWARKTTDGVQALPGPDFDDGRVTGKAIGASLQAWLLGESTVALLYDNGSRTVLQSLDQRIQFSMTRQKVDGSWFQWTSDVTELTDDGQNTPLETIRHNYMALYVEYRGPNKVAGVPASLLLSADFFKSIFDGTWDSWDYKTGPAPTDDITAENARSLSVMCASPQMWAYGAGYGASYLSEVVDALAMHVVECPGGDVPIQDFAAYGLKNMTEDYHMWGRTAAKAAGLGVFA